MKKLFQLITKPHPHPDFPAECNFCNLQFGCEVNAKGIY